MGSRWCARDIGETDIRTLPISSFAGLPMGASRRRGRTIVALLAIACALAVTTGVFAILEFGPRAQPPTLRGAIANASVSRPVYNGSTYPILNATLNLSSPVSLDPSGLIITIVGPNISLKAWDCDQYVLVSELNEKYAANGYPHWIVSFPANAPGSVPGAVCGWDAYAVTFTNPDGAAVGSLNSSTPSDGSIESGALMSMEFPGGPGFSTTGTGFVITLTEAGYSSSVAMTTP